MGSQAFKPQLDLFASTKCLLNKVRLTLKKHEFALGKDARRVEVGQHRILLLVNFLKHANHETRVFLQLVFFSADLRHLHLKAQVKLVVVLGGLIGVASSSERVEVLDLDRARVGQDVVFLNDEVLGDRVLVVDHNDLAAHQLKAGIPD